MTGGIYEKDSLLITPNLAKKNTSEGWKGPCTHSSPGRPSRSIASEVSGGSVALDIHAP